MRLKLTTLLLGGLMLITGAARADQPLETALGLNMEQARQVINIQAKYRKTFAAKRGQRNTELRKLRRARIAKDSSAVAQLEQTTEKMRQELVTIRAGEDAEIRRLLTPEQKRKFEDYIKLRKEMVGSSRDERDL